MEVRRSTVKYVLYIEGIHVPTSSIQVVNSVGSGVTLSASIKAAPEALKLKPNMQVFLFREKNVNGKPTMCLRFAGSLSNISYAKQYDNRSLVIQANSLNFRWRYMSIMSVTKTVFSGSSLNVEVVDKIREGIKQLKGVSTKGYSDEVAEDILAILSESAKWSSIGSGSASDNFGNATASDDPVKLTAKDLEGKLAQLETKIKAGQVSIKSIFSSLLEQVSNDDYISTLVRLVNLFYLTADLYSREYEYKVWKVEKMVSSLGRVVSGANNRDSTFATKSELSVIANSVIGSVSTASSIESILNSLLNLAFYSLSVSHMSVENSILFHPQMQGMMPPKCNVIFENMYSAMSLNRNLADIPTRSIVSFPVRGGAANTDNYTTGSQELYGLGYIYLAPIADISVSGITQDSNKDSPTILEANKKLRKIEAEQGVVSNIITGMCSSMNHLTDKSKNVLGEYIHSISEASKSGSCRVSCGLVDDLAVGMPTLILDKEFSIYGIIGQFSFSVSEQGIASSSIEIIAPRFIYTESLPVRPLWLENMEHDKIGESYLKMFGCGAACDDFDLPPSTASTEVAKKIVEELTVKYNDESVNRHAFEENYRLRKEVTIDEVFKDCESVVGEDGNKYYYGGRFGTQKVGDYPVNKQQFVLPYLQKYYKVVAEST
jgi:hypothetical protein